MADRPGFVIVWWHDFSAVAEKLQNTQSWNFASNCSLVRGWRPCLFSLKKSVTNK